MIQAPSQTFLDIVNGDGRTFRVAFYLNGTLLTGDVGSVTFYRGASGRTPDVGSIFIPYLDAEIRENTDSLEGETITAKVGVVTDRSQNTVEWINFGTYVVSKPEKADKVTRFRAVGTLGTIGGDDGNITQSYPLDIASAISEIQAGTGVTITTAGVSATGTMTTAVTGSWRDMLATIAGELDAFLTEDVNGNWVLAAYGGGSTVSVAVDRSQTPPQYGERTYELTGLTVESGTVNMSMGNPLIDPWDLLSVTDLQGATHLVPCLQITHHFDGGLSTDVDALVETEIEKEVVVVGPIQRQLNDTTEAAEQANADASAALDATSNLTSAVDGNDEVTVTVTATSPAFTDASVDVDASVFGQNVDNESGTYTFTYDGSDWLLDGASVTLASYGITLDETVLSVVVVDDEITINYEHEHGLTSSIDSISQSVTNDEETLRQIIRALAGEGGIAGAIDVVALSAVVNSNTELDNKITAAMTFGTENGKPTLEIASTDSEFATRFTNSAILFLQNGSAIASITGQQLVISNAAVNRLNLGKWALIPRSGNNNLSLKWIG